MSYELGYLSNSMPVVSFKIPSVRTVAINYIVGVGSRYESEGEEGISHFLEHMAFKGTKTRTARRIAEEFDAIGGQFNAYTSKEHTVYYAKVLDIHLEKALDILSDIILESKYEQEDIKKEYQVICQEIAQTKDNPDDLCYENFIQEAYKDQPLGKSILGTEDTIGKFTTTSFSDYVNKYYTAKNSVLSVAGNIDNNNLLKLAEKNFSKLQEKQVKGASNSRYLGGLKILNKDLEQSNLFLGFNSCSYKEMDEFYKTQILSLILGGGLSSRLFQKIREDLGLVYSVGSFNSAFSDNGIFSLYAGTSHEKIPEVIDAMLIELANIIENISEKELARAKEQIKACIIMAEEKTAYKSEEVGKNFILFERYISSEEVLEKVQSTSAKEIQETAKKIFSSNPTLSIVGNGIKDIDITNIKVVL